MKKIVLIMMTAIIWSACSDENKPDKKAELKDLQKQQSELNDKIKKLRDELAAADTGSESSKVTLVKIAEMAPVEFNHYIEVQAHVDGDEDIMVNPETMGTVVHVAVKAGDRVDKGQLLASLDDRILKQSLGELQSQLDLVTSLYNRQKNLWDQKIGSEVQFMQAKTNKEALEKRMASLQEQWEMTRIKSPISGTVDAVNIKVGMTVSPAVPAVHVVNLNYLKVKGEVAESYISKVKKGNAVLIYFPDLQKEIRAKVDYSGNSINVMNRTFNVEVRLNAAELDYRPNMVAILKIVDYTAPATITVPVKTIQGDTDGNYVYLAVEENGKTICRKQHVKTGLTYNGNTEIKDGLKAGDKLITMGYTDLVEGQKITY